MVAGGDKDVAGATGDVVGDIDEWFVERGVPHFIESETEGSALDVWTRALPLLIVAYLLLCLNSLELRNWSGGENAIVGVLGVLIGVAAWMLSNKIRGRPAVSRPRDIDAPELAVFLIGPALPSVVFGQPGDAIETVLTAILLLVVIYLWSAYGVGAMFWWGVRESVGQLGQLTSLVARGLPLLLIFNTFLFVNAEVWEVAGNLRGWAYVVVIATFFALGAFFALSRIPHFIRELNQFESWPTVARFTTDTPAASVDLPTDGAPDAPLKLSQKFNIGLMVLFGQAIQITAVVVVITCFFIGFGFMTIGEGTILRWTGMQEVQVYAEATLDGRELILTESLLRVSIFLGAFSGMYFTVLLTTDDTYQEAISDRVGPQIREALAVRTAYRVARAGTAEEQPPAPTNESHVDNGVA